MRFAARRHGVELAALHRRLLGVRSTQGAQVVGRLHALLPSVHVHAAHTAHVRIFHKEVERLALIDPLSAVGGGFDKPLLIDLEDFFVFIADAGGGLFGEKDLCWDKGFFMA